MGFRFPLMLTLIIACGNDDIEKLLTEKKDTTQAASQKKG